MSYSFSPALIIDGTLYVLIAFSIITWTLIIYKIWELSSNNFHNRLFDDAFWESTDTSIAKAFTVKKSRGPLTRIALCGFNWIEAVQRAGVKTIKFQSLSPQELLEQALRKQIQEEQHRIESGLTLLASIGSTAPFVGLFGTVFGIMRALQDISKSGSASLDVVAGPIGDALIATAVGIAVAVPAVLAYNFFQRRSKLQRLVMENFADGFMHIAFTKAQPKQE
ncbi:MAG: MotA/TolQ/ExbB proton channel family protein [Methylococcales bacterium]